MNKSILYKLVKSKRFNYFIIILIVISILSILLDFLLPKYEKFFFYLEVFYTTIFVIEYFLRWSTSKNRLKYPFGFFAIIDLLAILPTILMFSSNFTALRILRIARILRVLKITRYVNFYIWFSTQAKKRHLTPILIKIGAVFGLWIFGAVLLLLTENSKGFISISDSLWNVVIITMSGLDGDTPVSNLGKFEVAFLMFLGILIVGFITGEIISALMERGERKGKIELLPPNTKLSNHIVIINQNKQLYNIIEQINGAYNGNCYIVVVSEGIKDFEIHNKKLAKRVLGLDGDILNKKNFNSLKLEEALSVIILSPEENENRGVISAISIINKIRELKEDDINIGKNFKLVIEVRKKSRYEDYQNILPRLDEIKENIFLFYSGEFVDKLMAQAVVNPHCTPVYNELMTYTDDSNEFYREYVTECIKNFTLKELQNKFFDKYLIFIGVETNDGKVLVPDFDEKLGKYKAVFFIAYNYEKESFSKWLKAEK